jgi:ATP-binding cassette, subfamily B (MDR/TAP), member 1
MALLPVGVGAGYLRFALLNNLNRNLRDAYSQSATLATEQVAAIRTVASLNREKTLHQEYMASLETPVRKAMYNTLQSTAVHPPV